MLKYTWKDGCFHCENGINISHLVYSDAIQVALPMWYGCTLNENIMVEISLRIPPEKCPKRKE